VIKEFKKAGTLMTGTPEITIQNIVANANLGGAIDLVEFCESERHGGGSVIYEPEQFPAIIYRMNKPRAVMLILASGKIVFTGVRKGKDVHIAAKKLLRKLEEQNLIYKQ